MMTGRAEERTARDALLERIERVHTTEMGRQRICTNLTLKDVDAVEYCIERIKDADTRITRRGKNFYAETADCVITVNAHSCTIITAHKKPKSAR